LKEINNEDFFDAEDRKDDLSKADLSKADVIVKNKKWQIK
jgi:hypothetical protein